MGPSGAKQLPDRRIITHIQPFTTRTGTRCNQDDGLRASIRRTLTAQEDTDLLLEPSIVKVFHGAAEADHRWIGRARFWQEPDRVHHRVTSDICGIKRVIRSG